MNLKRIELPPGPVGGFDVGFDGWNGSGRLKLPNPVLEGFDGYDIVGQGRDVTHILPSHDGNHAGDSTIFVGRGCGALRISGATVHAAERKAIHMGLTWDGEPLGPSSLMLKSSRIYAPPSAPCVWGVLTWNTNVLFEDVEIELASHEHGLYAHGYNPLGMPGVFWDRVNVRKVGAEGLKVATRPEEVAFVPGASINVRASRLANWYTPELTWRGGGGIVLQGSGAESILLKGTHFLGGAGARGRCFMVDDGGGGDRFYGPEGKIGEGAANGTIRVEGCGFSAGPGVQSFSDILRVGRISQEHTVPAESVSLVGNGFYGEKTLVSIGHVDPSMVNVSNNNSAAFTEAARGKGIDTMHSSALKVGSSWSDSIRFPEEWA